MPADNERFGASGGVSPQEKQCELASEYPATTVVSPPPSPSRRTLCVSPENVVEKVFRPEKVVRRVIFVPRKRKSKKIFQKFVS
jgi:hypothetical protein